MEKVVMDEELLGHRGTAYITEPSQDLLVVHLRSIRDLPLEIMEMIFEELDSVNRKKIERVCKEWMHIIRGAKRFRTHLKIETPPYYFQDGKGWRRAYKDWFMRLAHLVKPDLEVLHFKSRGIPANIKSARSNRKITENRIKFQNLIMALNPGGTKLSIDQSNRNIKGHVLQSILMALKEGGADLSKVDIVFTGCVVDCEMKGQSLLPQCRKVRIIRSEIMATDWFGRATLIIEELWLETPDKLSRQIADLFLPENGPLTEVQSDKLRKVQSHVTIAGEPDIGRVHNFAGIISGLQGGKYVDGYNWFEALMTVANGGHVSSHTIDPLEISVAVIVHTQALFFP